MQSVSLLFLLLLVTLSFPEILNISSAQTPFQFYGGSVIQFSLLSDFPRPTEREAGARHRILGGLGRASIPINCLLFADPKTGRNDL